MGCVWIIFYLLFVRPLGRACLLRWAYASYSVAFSASFSWSSYLRLHLDGLWCWYFLDGGWIMMMRLGCIYVLGLTSMIGIYGCNIVQDDRWLVVCLFSLYFVLLFWFGRIDPWRFILLPQGRLLLPLVSFVFILSSFYLAC